MGTKNWSKGKFIPQYPEKYIGDPNNIIYRSSWELSFNMYIDKNPNVIKWASEGLPIQYLHPFYTEKRIRTYYPDYYIEYITKDGTLKKEILEIKPENQIILPAKATKSQKETYAINLCKWNACKIFCDKYGIEFRLLTEKQLFR